MDIGGRIAQDSAQAFFLMNWLVSRGLHPPVMTLLDERNRGVTVITKFCLIVVRRLRTLSVNKNENKTQNERAASRRSCEPPEADGSMRFWRMHQLWELAEGLPEGSAE